jgi:hypothetical protein
VEIAHQEGGFAPELSFGTHFFQDLVETGIFYVAIFPQQETVIFNPDLLTADNNQLCCYLPDHSRWQEIIQVFEVDQTGRELWLQSDMRSRSTVCAFLEPMPDS